MITTVIFDMGKVLVDYKCDPVIRQKTNDPQLIDKIIAYLFNSGQWVLLDAGLISLHDALNAVLTHFNEEEKEIVTFCFNHWNQYNLFAKPDMIQLVHDLHQQGYRLFVLSNANQLIHEVERQVIPHYDCFEKVYFSCDYRLLKPQYPLYQKVLTDNALEPSQCLFVDDLYDNVCAAKTCGINGVVFDGTSQCVIDALAKLNAKEG